MEANIPHTKDDIEPLHFDKIYNKQATLYPQPDDEYGTALCVNLSDGTQFRLVLLKENRKRKDWQYRLFETAPDKDPNGYLFGDYNHMVAAFCMILSARIRAGAEIIQDKHVTVQDYTS